MNAIGLVEVVGYVAAIEAGDVCVKSANVNIVGIEKVGAGIVTLIITGDVGAVKSAVESAELAVSKLGNLRTTHVIPRIHTDVADTLLKKEEVKEDFTTSEEISTEKTIEVIETVEEILEEKADELNQLDHEVSKEDKLDNSNLEIKTNDLENYNENSSVEDKSEESEVLHIENQQVEKINNLNEEQLYTKSVKELRSLANKFDPSITNKTLNSMKKEELINLVKKLGGEDK